MKRLLQIAAVICLCCWTISQARADETPEQSAIHLLLNKMFDKPGSRLTVFPIVVEGSYAVADWTQGDMGGRGLLRRDNNGWILILCSGDGLKSASFLQEAGISADDASKLTNKLAEAESTVDGKRIAQLSKFGGVMYVDKDAATTHPEH